MRDFFIGMHPVGLERTILSSTRCVSMAFLCVFTDWSKGFNEEAVINPVFSQIFPFTIQI